MFGTEIVLELVTLARALQIALGPILILWLGSLYNTRHRESLYIGKSTDIRQVFPHLINVYPVGVILPELRRRSWIGYYRPAGLAVLFWTVRAALVSLFIGPPCSSLFSACTF